MAKLYSFLFTLLCLTAFSACQTVEQLSIDYMLPADISFPTEVRKIAIVNNISPVSNSSLTALKESDDKALVKKRFEAKAQMSTEACAKKIAEQNYFDEVIICDSALRSHDILLRENSLSQEEVKELTSELDADCLVSLEDLYLKVNKTVSYLPDFGCYRATADLKAYTKVSIYIPTRQKPMITIYPNDSVFWEDYGLTQGEALAKLPKDEQIAEEASEFAGTVPVKYLTPSWQTGKRYLYVNGSVNMRDAAVYVRENSWDKAYKLWEQTYNETKSARKKMNASLNIALYYEMKDSIEQALEWALTAQELAHKVEKVKKKTDEGESIQSTPGYFISSIYMEELRKRKANLPKLNMQMQRFEEKF